MKTYEAADLELIRLQTEAIAEGEGESATVEDVPGGGDQEDIP